MNYIIPAISQQGERRAPWNYSYRTSVVDNYFSIQYQAKSGHDLFAHKQKLLLTEAALARNAVGGRSASKRSAHMCHVLPFSLFRGPPIVGTS